MVIDILRLCLYKVFLCVLKNVTLCQVLSNYKQTLIPLNYVFFLKTEHSGTISASKCIPAQTVHKRPYKKLQLHDNM